MPQFTQWNVPDPFPNILYNPAAVDAAIAKTQSELGNLDINRQELQLRKDEFARGQSLSDRWKQSLDGTGTTGTTGAVPGGGGSFLGALARIESGDKNIVSGTDKDNQGLTLAQGGNPQEISQGHFQIHTGTWKDFAPQAGVDVSKYPNAMSAPREIQAQVASVIPFKRFGPRTQTMMRQQFGDIDSNRTVGELAGLGPRAGSAAVAGPVAVAPPPATRQAGVLPVPPIPPAAVPAADPNARVEADDPNTAAVKQASAALLNMPEPDAAAAYPAVVRELQARGFAMNAPPTYPGHAALQALVGGEPAVAQTKTAARLGGTDVADASGVVVPTAATAAPRPYVILDESGKPLQAPPPAPNKMMAGTGLPGVTIGLPQNGMAPPAATQAAAAPAQAQPQAASPTLPPLAPSRVIQREPLIKSGLAEGLTRRQALDVADMFASGMKPGVVMQQVEQMRHQNDVIRQGDATQAAIDEKENYDRRRVAEQTAYTRAQDAKRDAREEVAAKNAGMPPGYRLSDKGIATRIDGLPPDPQVAQAAKDAYDAEQRKLPFQGTGTNEQNRNILIEGTDKGKVNTTAYKSAYADFSQPRTEGGVTIHPDMTAYRLPEDKDGNPITTYGKAHFTIGPGDITKLRSYEQGAAELKTALDVFADKSRNASFWERNATNLGQPTELSNAWTNAALLAKGDALYQLGVLSGPDMTVIRGALADPSTFMGRIASNDTIDKQVASIKKLLETRLDQARQIYGGGMSPGGGSAPAAPAATKSAPPPPPAVGAVQDGYRFKGGNPASPDSWEPVK